MGLVMRTAMMAVAMIAVAIASRGFQTPGRALPTPQGPGVAVGYGAGGQQLDVLGEVWYLDYGFATSSPSNHRRLFFIQLGDSPKRVAEAAKRSPGQWWTFGNEPNDPHQDNIGPQAYVEPYHDIYYALKSADPQARLVATGVANADWRWLDQWREDYRQKYDRYPPVDGWRFHDYVLETCASALNADEFKRRAVDFRDWVNRIGESQKPVLLTEYGVLYGNGCCSCPVIQPAAVVEYMRSTTDWLAETRIVTAWAWFAVDSGNRFNGDLFNGEQILPAGTAYQELTRAWDASK